MQRNDKQMAATIRHAGTNRANERRPTGRAREKMAKVILKTVSSAASVIAPSCVLSTLQSTTNFPPLPWPQKMEPGKKLDALSGRPPLSTALQSFSAHLQLVTRGDKA